MYMLSMGLGPWALGLRPGVLLSTQCLFSLGLPCSLLLEKALNQFMKGTLFIRGWGGPKAPGPRPNKLNKYYYVTFVKRGNNDRDRL